MEEGDQVVQFVIRHEHALQLRVQRADRRVPAVASAVPSTPAVPVDVLDEATQRLLVGCVAKERALSGAAQAWRLEGARGRGLGCRFCELDLAARGVV